MCSRSTTAHNSLRWRGPAAFTSIGEQHGVSECTEQDVHFVCSEPRQQWRCETQHRWKLSETPQIQVTFDFFKLIFGHYTFWKCLLLPNVLLAPHSAPWPWFGKPWLIYILTIYPLDWKYYRISTQETLWRVHGTHPEEFLSIY